MTDPALSSEKSIDDVGPLCDCRQCLRDREEYVDIENFRLPVECTQMILCSICGNKRCSHATDHRNPCGNSNESGQPGSSYP